MNRKIVFVLVALAAVGAAAWWLRRPGPVTPDTGAGETGTGASSSSGTLTRVGDVVTTAGATVGSLLALADKSGKA